MTFSALLAIPIPIGDNANVGDLFKAVIVLLVGLIVIKVLLHLSERALKKANLDRSLTSFARTAIKVLLMFILLLIIMGSLDIEVTSLVAVLSVAGLAVSLSIQNTLSNVASGLQLMSIKPFNTGDYVETAGVSGTIIEIGVFYTKMTTVDNKLVQIPNSEIASSKIINYSAEPNRRVDLLISASYEAPIQKVRAAVMSVIENHEKTLSDPAPQVRVNRYGDSAIEYVVRVWCENADYLAVYFDLLEEIKDAFDREGIEMTYNHLNVHIKEN